mgnify:CR=1 FL=1
MIDGPAAGSLNPNTEETPAQHQQPKPSRTGRALWKRAYSKAAEWLSAVVYEDPWLAGGHNGLSNSEDPRQPQDPYPRVAALRQEMRDAGVLLSAELLTSGSEATRLRFTRGKRTAQTVSALVDERLAANRKKAAA